MKFFPAHKEHLPVPTDASPGSLEIRLSPVLNRMPCLKYWGFLIAGGRTRTCNLYRYQDGLSTLIRVFFKCASPCALLFPPRLQKENPVNSVLANGEFSLIGRNPSKFFIDKYAINDTLIIRNKISDVNSWEKKLAIGENIS